MKTNKTAVSAPMAALIKAVSSGDIALDGVPEHLYHALPAMSSSGIKEFRKGPGYFKYRIENPGPDTPARLEGRLVHMALGEPARFMRDVVTLDGHRGKTDVKEQVAHLAALGKTVCKPEQFKAAKEVAEYCRAHPRVGEILKAGVAERSFFWKDPTTGVQCKARADWVTKTGVLVDWKTFDKVYDDDALEYQIRSMGYQFQAAWYLEGYYRVTKKRSPAFYHGFIRHEPPYDVAIKEICAHSVEEAVPYIERVLARYAECLKTNHWPMTSPEVGEIEVRPFWR